MPTATQFEVHYLILKWKTLLSTPFSKFGSIRANLYPAVFWDLTRESETSLMSLCLKVGENLNLGADFHIFVLLTDSSNPFWYYFNFLFTYSTLLEIIEFTYWL